MIVKKYVNVRMPRTVSRMPRMTRTVLWVVGCVLLAYGVDCTSKKAHNRAWLHVFWFTGTIYFFFAWESILSRDCLETPNKLLLDLFLKPGSQLVINLRRHGHDHGRD